MSVTFDGANRRIIVNPGVSQIDVSRDLYSEWKLWVLQGNNTQYLPAFRVFGGDQTIVGQFAPSYFFLINGWRVIVDNQNVVIGINLYTDEGDSPIIAINGGTASVRNSDAPIVRNSIENALDYGGYIVIDQSTPNTGIDHPYGTNALPVNNPTDALIIANKYGITKYLIRGHITIINDMSSSTFIGDSYGSRITVESFASVHSSFFKNLIIDGDFSGGDLQAESCIIGDSLNISGELVKCGISSSIHVKPYGILTLDNCSSRSPSTDVIINMNPTQDVSLNIRGFSGDLLITNCDTPASVASIDINGGRVTLAPSCTLGSISIKGVTKVIDNSNGTLVDTSLTVPNMIDTQAISDSINQNGITIDNTEILQELAKIKNFLNANLL